MRPHPAVLLAALLVAGCTESVEGAPTPGGALLEVREDSYTGIDSDGAGGRILTIALDSTGAPVVLATAESGGQWRLARGADVAEGVPVDEFAGNGIAAGFGLTPDDTAVVLGEPGSDSDLSGPTFIRIAPDGTQQPVPVQLTEDQAGLLYGLPEPDELDWSDDASRVVHVDVARDSSQGFPLFPGDLGVLVLDTTTGAAVASTRIPLFEPVADIPGQSPPLDVLWTAITPDGGVVVSTVDDQGVGEVRWLDPSLAVTSTTTAVPGGFPALAPDGTVYVATPDEAGTLVRLSPGDAEPEVVAQLPADWFRTSGLAVDGEHAYLTGSTYTGDDFPESVLAVDLATGSAGTPVVVCADGSIAGPQLRGDTVLVAGTCNDDALLQEHVYLLGAA